MDLGAGRRVVVFGSLHYDIMVDAPALPRRGETVAGHGWRPKCGGKGGNQAVAAARAGAPTWMIGAVGDDDFGRTLRANLEGASVDVSHVRTAAGAASGFSVAITEADGDYGAVIASGANLSLGETDVLAASALLAGGGVLVLQNEVPEVANVAAARAAAAAGCLVILNAAPARALPAALVASLGLLVVNAIEAEMLGAADVDSLDAAAGAARRLCGDYGATVVTAGRHGLAYAAPDNTGVTLPAVPLAVVSTHGAGDTFVGTLAAALAAGAAMSDALQRANRAAAHLVSAGAVPLVEVAEGPA